MTPQVTLTDWIFFLLQVALSVAGIWLGIYLFLRQQREAQNERYKEINKSLENINSQVRGLSSKIQEVRTRLDNETAEIKTQIALIERTTSQTQSQIWLSHDRMVERVVTQLIGDKLALSVTKYRLESSGAFQNEEANTE